MISKCGISSTDGLTLVETILAMGILAIALLTILQVVINASVNNELNRYRVEAVQHAETLLSEMRLLRDEGGELPDAIVSEYPAGEYDFPAANLPDEVVTIAYEDPAALPLVVTVTVQWRALRGRIMSDSLSTALDALS